MRFILSFLNKVMKNKQLRSYFGIMVSAILAATIFCLPYQQAFGVVRSNKITTPHIEKKSTEHKEGQSDKLEREIRKAYNIPNNVEIYISTNPPPAILSVGDVIPVGTTVFAFSDPLKSPSVVLPLGCLIVLVVIVIVVAGVIIYVVYKCCKLLDKNPPADNINVNIIPSAGSPADTFHIELFGGTFIVNTNNQPNFDIGLELPNMMDGLTDLGPRFDFNSTNFTGNFSFTIQSSFDLVNWQTEYQIITTITNGTPNLIIYNNNNQAIMTNSVMGIYDGNNLISAPGTGILMKDQTIDAYKFWRVK